MLARSHTRLFLGTHGFNPGVCMVGEKLAVAFRVDPRPGRGIESRLYMGHFEEGSPWKAVGLTRFRQGCEDPRLFVVAGQAYCSYTRNHLGRCNVRFASVAGDLAVGSERFIAYGKPPEKNWVFFDYDARIHCVYQPAPHEVLELRENGEVAGTWSTEWPSDVWSLGEPRGGTPPLRVDDMYLSFFHSHMRTTHYRDGRSAGRRRRHYYTGAYVFEAQPPFTIRGVTKQPVLEPWNRATQDFFVGGATDAGEDWRLFYGAGKKTAATCLVDKRALAEELGIG